MTGLERRQKIEAQAEVREFEVLFLDGFDEAILGIAPREKTKVEAPVVVYSIKGIIDLLLAGGCKTLDEAYEYYSHNVDASYGEKTPIFVEDD